MPQDQAALIKQASNPRPTQLPSHGGASTTTLTSAGVVKASVGTILGFTINNLGTTSGAFTINDCATTGAATTGNQVITVPYNGDVTTAEFVPFYFKTENGITLSAVPGGGSPSISIKWM